MLRRVSFAITRAAAPVAMAGLVACGLAACGAEPAAPGARSLAVQPRVVVDGMLELGATAQTQVIVDELLFHAPSVALATDGHPADDLLDGEDALLFRYEAGSSDGFGDVVGAERRWTVHDAHADGDLVVGFAPLETESMLEGAGVDLSALAGHTAMMHGYVLLTAPDAQAVAGKQCGGETGGAPAACFPGVGDAAEGDPDGNPSEGDPDGNPAKAEGDPDGNPAKTAEGDPDGNPAKTAEGDPDGNPAEGDPDGNPSEGRDVAGRREGEVVRRTAAEPVRIENDRLPRERVPFLLVVNRSFALRVPVADLFETALDDDEVRPLELHVRIDELLSDELLKFLSAKASEERGSIVIEIPAAEATSTMGLDVDNEGVQRRVSTRIDTGLRVIDRH